MMSRAKYIEKNSGTFFYEQPTQVSPAFNATSTATVGSALKAIALPAGAYVTRVALLSVTSALSSTDIDIGIGGGTGADSTLFMNAVTTLGLNVIRLSATGRYVATATWIRAGVQATGTTGTFKVMAWYYV